MLLSFYFTGKIVLALPCCSLLIFFLWERREDFWTSVILTCVERLKDSVKLKIIHFALVGKFRIRSSTNMQVLNKRKHPQRDRA